MQLQTSFVENSRNQLIKQLIEFPRDGRRRLVAIAGPPASGKSQLAEFLCQAVVGAGREACVIPMDGFHKSNDDLSAEASLQSKGAPETYDTESFFELVHQVKNGGGLEYPLFDRNLDSSILSGGFVEPECDIAIFEGNYLLLDEDPWRQLTPLWDLSVWLETSTITLEERLVERWLAHDHSHDSAVKRAQIVDLKNARRAIEARLPSDVTLFE